MEELTIASAELINVKGRRTVRHPAIAGTITLYGNGSFVQRNSSGGIIAEGDWDEDKGNVILWFD